MQLEKFGKYQLGDIVIVKGTAYVIGKISSQWYVLLSLADNVNNYFLTTLSYNVEPSLSFESAILVNHFINENIFCSHPTIVVRNKAELSLEKVFKYPTGIYKDCNPISDTIIHNSTSHLKTICYSISDGTLYERPKEEIMEFCQLPKATLYKVIPYIEYLTPDEKSILMEKLDLANVPSTNLA